MASREALIEAMEKVELESFQGWSVQDLAEELASLLREERETCTKAEFELFKRNWLEDYEYASEDELMADHPIV